MGCIVLPVEAVGVVAEEVGELDVGADGLADLVRVPERESEPDAPQLGEVP